jgi:hypothetical protein
MFGYFLFASDVFPLGQESTKVPAASIRTPNFAQSSDETDRIKLITYFFVQISQIFTNKCSDIFV